MYSAHTAATDRTTRWTLLHVYTHKMHACVYTYGGVCGVDAADSRHFPFM